jgi:hypothetical protein
MTGHWIFIGLVHIYQQHIYLLVSINSKYMSTCFDENFGYSGRDITHTHTHARTHARTHTHTQKLKFKLYFFSIILCVMCGLKKGKLIGINRNQ